MPARVLLSTLALAAALLSASGAQAATVQVIEEPWNGGNALVYDADFGEANVLGVALVSGQYGVVDSEVTVDPGPGCFRPGSDIHTAICDATDVVQVRFRLLDGNDAAGLASPVASDLEGGTGADVILGGQGADSIKGDGVIISGSSGGGGADYIDGREGNDNLDADVAIFQSGGDTTVVDDDTVIGGTGDDFLSANDGNDALDGGAGADILSDGPGNDTIKGGDGDDDYWGDDSGGDDAISGEGGNDVLRASREVDGADSFSGGPGQDSLLYNEIRDPGLPAEARAISLTASLDGVPNDGSGAEGDNLAPDIETVTGGLSDDVLIGSPAAERLNGEVGNDVLDGRAGDDLLQGRDGGDTLVGADGQDRLEGGDGNDTVDGSSGADTLLGELGNDALDGGSGDDLVQGLAGGDILAGGEGRDRLEGGDGDDSVDGGRGADVLIGEGGTDTARYDSRVLAVNVTLDDLANDGEAGEADAVSASVENVIGGGGPDDLTGGAGSNRLDGGSGEDFVDGRAGADALVGGDAADVLRVRDSSGDSMASCGPGVDFVIADPGERADGDCEAVDNVLGDRVSVGRQIAVQPGPATLGLQLPAAHRSVPLFDHVNIPVGSLIDTRAGKAKVTSRAVGSPRKRQSGVFWGALFQVLQSRSRAARGLTELQLKGGSFDRCRATGGRVGAAQVSRRTIRKLRADTNKGRFRTRGRHSAATVRGTVWITSDRCDGTLTKVTRGKVAVRDLRRKRTILLRAGKSYLARAVR